MHARYSLILCALFAVPFDTLANDSCGLHAAGLISSGKTKELAELFGDSAGVLGPLQRMVAKLGKIAEVQETFKPRFVKHTRLTIQAKDLPAAHPYRGYWINVLSENLGPVQFHIGSALNSTCKLLAVHLDTEI
jgi:hypothetical protein